MGGMPDRLSIEGRGDSVGAEIDLSLREGSARRGLLAAVLGIGVLLVAICAWRVTTNRPAGSELLAVGMVALSPPPLELVDSSQQLVRLQSYLGRHRVVVIFAARPSEQLIDAINHHADALDGGSIKLMVVTRLLPQQNRELLAAVGGCAFPILSDVDGMVFTDWQASEQEPTIYVVQRDGRMAAENGRWHAEHDLTATWKKVLP